MNKLKVFRYVFAFFVVVGGLYYVFYGVEFSEILNSLAGINPFFIILFYFVQIVITFLLSLRWKMIIAEKNVDIGYLESFRFYMITFFFNIFLPARAGDFYRGYITSDHDFIDSSFLIMKEKLFDLILIALIFSILALSLFGEFSGYVFIIGLVVFGGLTAITFLFKVEKIPFLNHYYEKIRKSFLEIFKTDKTIKFFLITVLIWSLEVLEASLLFYALGVDISLFLITFITFSWSLLSAIPISPAGLGSTDAAVLFILVSSGIFRPDAVSFVVSYRGLLVLFSILLGGYFYINEL